MKTTYIIFRDRKPQNNKETLDLLVHFCREHNLSCNTKINEMKINIEGEDYYVSLKRVRDDFGAAYWRINCLHKSRVCVLKKMA